MKLIRLQELPDEPWRNGGGTTRTLLAWPTVADWQLRVSVARIGRDGPFSAFPGVARHFAVLAGQGVELSWGDRVVRLTPGSGPLAFDGADPPACRLLDGATDDLNLMARDGAGLARLERLAPARAWAPRARWRGLYTHAPARLLSEDGEWPLAAGTLAWTDAPAPPWSLQGADPGPDFGLSLATDAR